MFFLLIGFFLIFSFLPAQGTQDPQENTAITENNNFPEPAHITYIEGVVKLNAEDAEVNLPIVSSDELKTEDGRVEVCLDGNYFRLDKNTHVVFIDFREDLIMLAVKQGNVYVRVENKITVQTPHKEFSLSTGMHLIKVTATIAECISNAPVKDDFDQFNEQREQELIPAEETEDTGYLPEELNEYENTLSQYGEWRDHDRYGHVWIPNVSSDYWQPYYYGRWTYIPILGWFWASYESFGWCTYHYGRWHWDPMWGSWYWIPTTIWGPGWVNWYGWGNYWGWCPRWYDSWYYGRYYDSYYRYGYGRAWTFVRKDQLRNRNIHAVAARRSELQSMAQISSNQLLRKSVAPALNQISRSSSQQISRGTISQIQSISSRPQAQISRKSSTTQIQGYPSRISSRSSTSPQSQIFSSSRSSTRSLSSRSSRQSFYPNRSFSRPSPSPRSSPNRSYRSMSSSPRLSASPRSFSAPRSSSSHSYSSSISRSSSPRSSSPSRSSSSPRRKN